jgi:divalent metal cation (Fe/Co/Zn/Cd) transporter
MSGSDPRADFQTAFPLILFTIAANILDLAWGSSASISVTTGLVLAKRSVGKWLNSDPIPADANCALVCIYMSIVLLASSALFEATGFGFPNSLGALEPAAFSFHKGRESLEKARGRECECAEL